jgi:hypothetical protein
VRYSLAPRRRPRRAARKVLACRGFYWGVPRPQPIADGQEWPQSGNSAWRTGGHRARARKAKAAQFVSSSFLDWICCCCCCVTGLPSLGHINCSSLKLRRMEANSTAEPFAMVCSRCATRRLRKPQKRLIGRYGLRGVDSPVTPANREIYREFCRFRLYSAVLRPI